MTFSSLHVKVLLFTNECENICLDFEIPEDASTEAEENETPMDTNVSSMSPAQNITLPPGVDFGKCNIYSISSFIISSPNCVL